MRLLHQCRFFTWMLVLCLSFGLAACGGSGGAVSTNYTGLAEPAELSIAQASVWARLALHLDDYTHHGGVAGSLAAAKEYLARVQTKAGPQNKFIAASLDQTEHCELRGLIRIGSRFDAVTGSPVIVDFENCQDQRIVVNGKAEFSHSNDSSHVNLDLLVEHAQSGRQIRLDGVNLQAQAHSGGRNEVRSGRLYDAALGYVDIETRGFLYFAAGDAYPADGKMILNGANQQQIVMTALSSTQVLLQLELDGQPGFDYEQTLTWADIDAQIKLPARF